MATNAAYRRRASLGCDLRTEPAVSPSTGNASSLDSTSTELSVNSRDVIIGDQWLVLAKIGWGSFGEVFKVQDIHTGMRYAIKRESHDVRNPQLKHESLVYDALFPGPGIPQCHWYGQHDDFDCIVIDLLGPSLKQLRESVADMPIDIVTDFGCQMITIFEHIHNRGILYRDVKPENFLFPASCVLPKDTSENMLLSCTQVLKQWGEAVPKVYAVDFGLASWWRNPTTHKPYPEARKPIRNKTGTARYASLNVHHGKAHARRDDMESLGYVLLDLARGSLPWTGIQARNPKIGWDIIGTLKEEASLQDVCGGLPLGFLKFIEYTRHLRFTEQPDYNFLRRLMRGSVHGDFSALVQPLGSIPHSPPLAKESHEPFVASRRNVKQAHPVRAPDHHEVFFMDDLAQELPVFYDNKSPKAAYPRRRRTSSNYNRRQSYDNGNIGCGPRVDQRLDVRLDQRFDQRLPRFDQRQDQRHGHERHENHFDQKHDQQRPASVSTMPLNRSSWHHRGKREAIGWNTHRHAMPWEPEPEWDTLRNKCPENNAMATVPWSKGEHGALWGPKKQTKDHPCC
ncbi:kinase-like domain-containing protein [Phycomyces nitens]|nr:kinase-like domain-containing protein [Phycomyces nitens]